MLEVRSISKSFPGVKALDGVSVSFAPGTIHALLGENGAGKSTLMKIICGIYGPDEGEMLLEGRRLHLRSTFDALANRISIVHQEIQVVPRASVAENIMLDKLDRYRRGVAIDWKRLGRDAKVFTDMVDLPLPPETPVGTLSAAQKQLTQIARALSDGATILLLDEPTSSLTLHEVDRLFELLRKLKGQGVTIVFVSHKLEEVMALCDVVTVLRDGKLMGTRPRAELTKDQIIAMMIGRTTFDEFRGLLPVDYDRPVLEVRGLKSELFDGIDLTLWQGEILGLYGLVGSGRTELAKTHHRRAPLRFRHRAGAGEARPDRLRGREPAALPHRLREREQEGGGTDPGRLGDHQPDHHHLEPSRAAGCCASSGPAGRSRRRLKMIQRLDIKTPSPLQILNNLSGGNQQKVSIGKWLVADCDILILDEPTIGVDVGAKEYIHDLIWKMAREEGKSIILISSDMPELVKLSRRILVFKSYRIVGELADLNQQESTLEETSLRIGQYLA